MESLQQEFEFTQSIFDILIRIVEIFAIMENEKTFRSIATFFFFSFKKGYAPRGDMDDE